MERVGLRVIVGVLVVAGLLVAVDRGASFLVARSVARGLAAAQGLPDLPDVRFVGAPFLTQVAAGRYRRVDVTLREVPTAGTLVVDRLDARLHGVRAPAGAAVRGELTELPVDRGEAEAFVSFAALDRAADAQLGSRGVGITFARAAADRIAFTARIRSFLGTVTVRGQTKVTVQRGAVSVRLLPETLIGVPPALRAQVLPQVDLSRLVPALPYGFRATGVDVDPEGLRVRAAGAGLVVPA